MKKLLCLLFVGVFLFASDYGRISGRVTDEETGEALIGADVYLQGTELGAATDVSGEYSILYVPVGTYQVVAAYVGYNEFTYTRVVVNADQTTVLNFKLPPTVITVGEVVSVAERPMIVISETSTGHAVTSQEMGRLPVTTINQVITLQAGVVESDLGTHVRGGRADEITYFVDGIVTKVPNFGWQS
ncbi:MAG: carboxypeptidase-like regulatory domain-containing protein, partial [bacterium]